MEWVATAVAGVTAFGANKSDALENLNLERYVKKLASEDGLGSAELARDAIALYQGFLRVARDDPGQPHTLPSADVDLVWQRHILDTMQYHADCERIFGAASYAHRIYAAVGGGGITLSVSASPPTDVTRQSSSATPEQLVDDEDLEWLGTAVATELPLKQDKCKHLDGPLTKIVMPADPAAAVYEYKRFLRMMIDDRRTWYTPSKLIDELWHRHMLDSKKYVAFCQRVAGYYLHHTPYYGEQSTFESWVAELRGHDPAGTLEAYESKWAEAPPVQIWG
eukprot:COSAG02_NODE_9600_length_2166_cov_1.061442_1_plen_278_part_10